MTGTAGAVALFIVLITLIVAGTLVLWTRDKQRSDEEATDSDRVAPDPNAEDRRDSYRG